MEIGLSAPSRASSRLTGFYKRSLPERRRVVCDWAALSDGEVEALECGLTVGQADHLAENTIGVLGVPLGVATHFQVNGADYLVPMAIEEPSVIAGASYAAKLVRAGGGFTAEAPRGEMIAQVQLVELEDLEAAERSVHAAGDEILSLANSLQPGLVARGGGARGLEVRRFAETLVGPMMVVHLFIDTVDAMGANAVNSIAEGVAPLLERATGGRAVLRILSNLADRRLARASCRVPISALDEGSAPGAMVARRIVEAQALAEVDPYRAATHNKGIMNGVAAVALATGNDWRGVEAGAHAYAARGGRYGPLTRWRCDPPGDLIGSIELPMAVGTVGGSTQAHPTARAALKILGVKSAGELACVMAAVGLAQNLAALRALAAEGIQRGHMELHARQIAVAAGATGSDVDRIAGQMVAENRIAPARARELMQPAPDGAEDSGGPS